MNGRHRKRDTETSDFVAMLERLMIAWGNRVAADPAALVHLRSLEVALRDNTNRGIFQANRGQNHYSQNEIAAILGITRIAVHKRIGLGEVVYAMLNERRGAGALVRIGDMRRERAAMLAAAGVEDKTGTERERQAKSA